MSVADHAFLPNRISTWGDLQGFLAADMFAHGVKKWTLGSASRHPVLRYQRLLRRVEFVQTRRGPGWRAVRFFIRYRLQRVGVLTGLTIPPGVFGPGLTVAHYGTVVVNSRARVGRFCRLHPGVTIGIANGGVPEIGDFVYIAPNAVVYGAVKIGDRAVIGANAVVNRDVETGTTVAGQPARKIADRGSDSVMPAHLTRRPRGPA